MATLRIGNSKGKGGIFKEVVLDIGRKVKIGIGYVHGKPQEQTIFTTLERLESAIICGEEPNAELWRRINKLPERIRKKLVDKHLIQYKDEGPTLEQVKTEFLAEKLRTGDPRTVRNYRGSLESGLFARLDGTRKIETIEADDLIGFINDSSSKPYFKASKKGPPKLSSKPYSTSTVGNQIKRAKSLFGFALDEGYITANPFDEKRVRDKCGLFTIALDPSRAQTQTDYMSPDEVDRLLACKKSLRSEAEDKEWNVLIHLLRFGGGRVSSYLVLRWKDINFDAKSVYLRMKRTSGKGKFHRGQKRVEVVPLFAELVEPLRELRAMQTEGTEYVLNQIGNLEGKPDFETTNAIGERIKQGRWETNLSTTFKKILRRNGFNVWDQPFHAFRSYRGAELELLGAGEMRLNSWIGNTAEIRKRHYSKFHMLGVEKFTETEDQSA